MLFQLCLLVLLFLPTISTTECTFPADIKIIESLEDIDYEKICPQFGDDMLQLLDGVQGVIPDLMKLPSPDDVPGIVNSIENIFQGFTGVIQGGASCIKNVLAEMCQTTQFKMLRALLSTFSVSAGLTVGLGVEATVGLSVNPSGVFDMICIPQDNTKAIYEKMDNLNETFLCALDKQTDIFIDVATKNLETTLSSLKDTENVLKNQLNATRDFLEKTMNSGFNRSEALARTFHAEATANLATLSTFISSSFHHVQRQLDDMAMKESQLLFFDKVTLAMGNLRLAYKDEYVLKINRRLNSTCGKNDPWDILSTMVTIAESPFLDDIVKHKQYSQVGISNLALTYQNAIKQAGFFIHACPPQNATDFDEEKFIETRQEEIAESFKRLFKLWEDNYYSSGNMNALVLDALNGTTGADTSYDNLAALLYKALVIRYGNTKYYFYAGVGKGAPNLKAETLEAISNDDTHILEHFGKTIYIMRALRATKYVDCFYFDQKNSTIPYFPNEKDAMEFHRKLCPGSQMFVHRYDYAARYGPGFRSYTLAYKNDSSSTSYVHVVHPLKVCKGYCIL